MNLMNYFLLECVIMLLFPSLSHYCTNIWSDLLWMITECLYTWLAMCTAHTQLADPNNMAEVMPNCTKVSVKPGSQMQIMAIIQN